MKKYTFLLTFGLLVVLGATIVIAGPALSGLRSAVLQTTPSFSTMTEVQLRAYIAEQDALIAQKSNFLEMYKANKSAAEQILARLSNSQVCANGKTNFPACDNTLCQAGYRLQNNECILDSECAVAYVYNKISEEAVTPSDSLSAQSAALNNPGSSTTSNTTPATKIEDSVDIDFTFTNPELEMLFLDKGDNVKLTYDRSTATIKGQFDVSGKTYICKPLPLKKESDTFAGIVCNAEKGDITLCQDGLEYSMSYECSSTSYAYILKKCPSSSNPVQVSSGANPNSSLPVSNGSKTTPPSGSSLPYDPTGVKTKPLSVTCAPNAPRVKRSVPVTWTATPVGGNGSYTYAWELAPDYTGDLQTKYTTSQPVKKYTRVGTKTAKVTLKSGSETASANCGVYVE